LLSSVMAQGHHVALVTDGRMSGASGKVPAAIHVTPEAVDGGPIARLKDGDMISLDAEAGLLSVEVPAAEWEARPVAQCDLEAHAHAYGRELFRLFRAHATGPEFGAHTFG